jgi:DNA-binding beta-propeller fold protein YncE
LPGHGGSGSPDDVAVADVDSNCVSVFSIDGTFIRRRHVGVGVLKSPHGVALTVSGELVVDDSGNEPVRVVVLSEEGHAVFIHPGVFAGVAVCGDAILVQDVERERCNINVIRTVSDAHANPALKWGVRASL